MCGQVDQVRLESAQHKAFIEVTKNSLMTMMEMMALIKTIIVVKGERKVLNDNGLIISNLYTLLILLNFTFTFG